MRPAASSPAAKAADALAGVGVEVERVDLAYGSTTVLRDVTLRIEPGEFFALLGPSGSGKSTLLRVIAGFAHPQRGRIVIGGEDMTRVPPWRRNVGMVFQNYALWPHMSVAHNVAFGLEERRLPKREIAERTQAALALVGLAELGSRRPGQLSGGQQQRVALARTLAVEPKVLLLDEPLSNLDAKLRVRMRQELRELQRKLGLTTIFVTHDQEEALTTSDRVAVMEEGVIRQVGTPIELYDVPANRFVADFVGSINFVPGRVERGGDGGARFVIGDGAALALPRDLAIPEGAECELAFRPHAVRLAARSGAALGRAPSDSQSSVAGTIVEREFLGEFVRYGVDVASVRIIADQPHLAGEPTFMVGDAVTASIAPQHLRILPRR